MPQVSQKRIRPPLPQPRPSTGTVATARSLAALAAARLQGSPALAQLEPATRTAMLRDLRTIQNALNENSPPLQPKAQALESFQSLRQRLGAGDGQSPGENSASQPADGQPGGDGSPKPTTSKPAATETIAKRAGALSDEIDFPAFVAGLVHGTFDAIVDSAIRQMESFAQLVSAVAKTADEFTRDNVTLNQARDSLVQEHPKDLVLDLGGDSGEARLRARAASTDDEPNSPAWLADYGLAGENLTDDLIEDQLVPVARQKVGTGRLQMLATMVLLGLNRIVVRDGSISARVRFRAAARDTAKVDYAVSQDPGADSSWGARGSSMYVDHDTKVSTVGVNVQSDSSLNVELFGEVKINFASETLPLDRFVDQARLTLLQNHARPITNAIAATPAPSPSSISPPIATAPPPAARATPPTPPAPPAPPAAPIEPPLA